MIKKLNQKGLSIIELVVGMVIAGIGTAVLGSVLIMTTKSSLAVQIKTTVLNLELGIISAITHEKFLQENRSNITQNPIMSKLGSIELYSVSEMAATHAFKIYSSSGNQYTGTSSTPSYFQADGTPCGAQSDQCIIKSTANIQFVCLSIVGSTCAGLKINEVVVSFKVEAISSVLPGGNLITSRYLTRPVYPQITNLINAVQPPIIYAPPARSPSSSDGDGDGDGGGGGGGEGGGGDGCGDGEGGEGGGGGGGGGDGCDGGGN